MMLIRIFTTMLLVAGLVLSCCTITINNAKLAPEYKGVDPKTVSIVNEWLSLAKDRGIKFKNTVTIGFKNMPDLETVGVCSYGNDFREIDIDRAYWEIYSKNKRTAMLYHELAHCYCGRGHDYGEKQYGSAEKATETPHEGDGFFKDGCPISLMYPIVVDDSCFQEHYGDYIKEIFNECDPF